jgi:7,8-dihydropterin-6-yl-methyl-4-(beta-D-ribofuranosyl)aminobenzene 5'-phosphate synthase
LKYLPEGISSRYQVFLLTVPVLHEADSVEVTVLVDNYADMLAQPQTVVDKRPALDPGKSLLAEHGLSCLVKVSAGGRMHTILLDAGLSAIPLFYNVQQTGCRLDEVEAVVLSHGHFDHMGGLCDFFRQETHQVPLVLHPDAFLARRLNYPKKGPVNLPQLDAIALKKAGADIQQREHASTLAAGHLLVSGEIPRTTAFEKGLPGAEAMVGGTWVPDAIRDDQALVINIHGRGLVVISGCAHAGIIDTVRYAQELTGIARIHAVLGGLHLNGPAFEPVIGPTIDAMREIDPDYIVPMHCTGWNAINRFVAAMPGKCILNTVGTTYVF